MTYGMFEMQMQDEQAHEDGMAIAAGMMCSFCLSVMHVANSYDTCPRIELEEIVLGNIGMDVDVSAEAAQLKKDADLDAYWKQQEGKPDFTCSHCKREFFTPNEGWFPGNVEPETLCLDCSLKERGII
jgi:hypothetical protein